MVKRLVPECVLADERLCVGLQVQKCESRCSGFEIRCLGATIYIQFVDMIKQRALCCTVATEQSD